jgi:hypothetical protein
MKADMADRRVRRGRQIADFGPHNSPWKVLRALVDSYPRRTPPEALLREEIELGTVYAHISKVRQLLEPLGIIIPHPGQHRGYVLAEAP